MNNQYFSFCLFWACLCLVDIAQGQAAGVDCVCFEEVPAAREYINPLIILSAEDGTDRLFIGEQTGLLYVFERNSSFPGGWTQLPEPFMNVSVYYEFERYDEQGFLALRFHPQYAENGLLYAWYSVFIQETGRASRLSEFRVDPNDSNKADPDYERVILEVSQFSYNHNGGDILFLADGTMVFFTGDGGIGGDPFNVALNKSSLLGKTLRIDVDNRDEGLEYAIPEDNPYLDDPTARPELYAIGFRNPWRAFADRGDAEGNGEGRIFIGDVGQSAWEEIDVLSSGANYGWSAFEASTCYKPQFCAENENHTYPIVEYSHTEGMGQCIIQGPMYRGCQNPDMFGWLIYGDYMTGNMEIVPDQGDSLTWTGVQSLSICSTCEDLGYVPPSEYAPYILTYGEDERGEIYVGSGLVEGLREPNGRVYKVIDPNNQGEPCGLYRK